MAVTLASGPPSARQDVRLQPGSWRGAGLGRRPLRGAGAPRLDEDGKKSHSRENTNQVMTRRRARVYQRCMSFLSVWMHRNMRILWVTLTTAPGGQARMLAHRHMLLLRRVAS